jgi:hypothetical protein
MLVSAFHISILSRTADIMDQEKSLAQEFGAIREIIFWRVIPWPATTRCPRRLCKIAPA